MSVDNTLSTQSSMTKKRNVLRRAERIAVMMDNGNWDDDSKPIGMPKTRVKATRKAGKPKKEAPEKE